MLKYIFSMNKQYSSNSDYAFSLRHSWITYSVQMMCIWCNKHHGQVKLKKKEDRQVNPTLVLPVQLSLILKGIISLLVFQRKKREKKYFSRGRFSFFNWQARNVTMSVAFILYLQCTALPRHSLLCPQFEQAPWYHSKKWRSGLLTQRSHCTDPYNQDLPTSNEDSPKKNKRSSVNQRQGRHANCYLYGRWKFVST